MLGLKIKSKCPPISHLLFADDSILFSKALTQYCENIIEVLNTYIHISGQVVNLNKSSVFFSNNTPQAIREQLAELLQVPHIGTQDKYLGLPAMVQRSKKATFSLIKDKVSKKLSHWKRTYLLTSEREVLIKAVATTISIYSFSCFKLSDTLLDELHKMMINFWWGQK